MAEITQETIEKIAQLAHVQVDDAEKEALTAKFRSILDFVAQLDEVDVSGVEAMTHAQQVDTPFRADEVKQTVEPQRIVDEAPAHEDNYFVVPRVIE